MNGDLKGRQAATIRAWWNALKPVDRTSDNDTAQDSTAKPRFFFDRGHRARLRRCNTLADAAQESSVWRLEEALKLKETEADALLLIAGVLAHVKEDAQGGRSLAYQLGVGPVAKDEKPLLSELRFQRLMRADEPNDFFQQLRRALSIGREPVDVAVLAEDLAAWSAERKYANRRSNGMKFRWARDYYLKRPDQTLLQDSAPNL